MADIQECPYVNRCGGCHIGMESYEEELARKQKWIEENIGKYCRVNAISGMYYPYHYRNKVHAV